MSGGERGGGSGMTFKRGDAVWFGPWTVETVIGNTAIVSQEGRERYIEHRPDDSIPHSDALPAVARWLAEFGAEALNGLIDAGTFCLNDGGEIVFDDPAYQAQLVAAGRALIVALAGGGEGAGE